MLPHVPKEAVFPHRGNPAKGVGPKEIGPDHAALGKGQKVLSQPKSLNPLGDLFGRLPSTERYSPAPSARLLSIQARALPLVTGLYTNISGK